MDASFERDDSPREVSTSGISPQRMTPAQLAFYCVVRDL